MVVAWEQVRPRKFKILRNEILAKTSGTNGQRIDKLVETLINYNDGKMKIIETKIPEVSENSNVLSENCSQIQFIYFMDEFPERSIR